MTLVSWHNLLELWSSLEDLKLDLRFNARRLPLGAIGCIVDDTSSQ